MQLRLSLSSPVLVLVGSSPMQKQSSPDAPPAYEAVSCSSHSRSLSLATIAHTQRRVTAHITLTVPSNQKTIYVLISLTVRLVAHESLVHNNGAFEQSCPVDIPVRLPIPPRLALAPGRKYTFDAELPSSSSMPPSVQLPDARRRYKLCVCAKTLPANCTETWLSTLLQARSLADCTDLLVVQTLELESVHFSDVKYLSIDRLGRICISISRWPWTIGESTTLNISCDSLVGGAQITKIDVSLVQDCHIHLRRLARSTSARQQKRRQSWKLASVSLPATSCTNRTAAQKAQCLVAAANAYQVELEIPDQVGLQPSVPGSTDSRICVSHLVELTIDFLDASHQTCSFTYRQPIIVAHSEATHHSFSDVLPAYAAADPTQPLQHQFGIRYP